MNSEQWIEKLAERARGELPPILPGSVTSSVQFRRRLETDSPRFPQIAMWVSGGVSLLAACVLLTIGMQMQTSTSTQVVQAQSNNAVSVLFAPLQTDTQSTSDSQ